MRVIADKRVLDKFKRRAIAALPNEHAEQLWGKRSKGDIHIYLVEPIDLTSQKPRAVDFTFDQECGSRNQGLRLFGSVHTHPNDVCRPSDADIESATEDGEIIFGILAIRKTEKRTFTSWGFWTRDGEKLELSIGE